MESDNIKLKEEIVSPPKYKSFSRKKVKLTDDIIEKIYSYLRENEEKRATGRSKQQKKKIDILDALHDDGYDIGYTTVCNAVNDIEAKKKEAFIRQCYNWEDCSEFDWGEVKLYIDGKLKVIQMGHLLQLRATGDMLIFTTIKRFQNFLHLHLRIF